MKVSSKITTKLFLDFCPEILCTFLGASWKLLGLPVGFLIYDITYSPGSPKSFQEAPRRVQKFQGRNTEIIQLLFWKKLSFHQDIIKLTDLYKLQCAPSEVIKHKTFKINFSMKTTPKIIDQNAGRIYKVQILL